MDFVSYLINGLSLGSVYAIIALGYTMVYGIAKMLNFAHGDVIMIGAYVALTCMTTSGLPPVASVLAAVVACTALGVLIERVAYKPLRNAASPLAVLITAIGVSYLLQNVALLLFGADTKSFTSVVTIEPLTLADGALVISGETIVTVAACIIIMIGLMTFMKYSKSGRAMLAVSEDSGAAQLMGVNVNSTIALTFAIGSALAAIAGGKVQAQEFKRQIEQSTFVPKGQWIAGSSISYSEHTEDNYQFLIIDGFKSDGYTFKVSPLVCYAFKDNIAAGGRFAYSRSLIKIDGLTLNIDDDNQFDINDLYQLRHTYSGMLILRNYISLGKSKRFALFNETQLEWSGSQSRVINGKDESVTGTFATTTGMSIGAAPGIVAFINNYTAVEVSIGVLGLNFSKTKQTTNQVYQGEHSSSSANFKINLFSIGLGLAFYL